MSPQTGEPARGSCFLQRIACLGRVILVLSPGLRPQLIFFDCFGCTWPIYLKEVYLFVFMCVFRSFWLLWLLASGFCGLWISYKSCVIRHVHANTKAKQLKP